MSGITKKYLIISAVCASASVVGIYLVTVLRNRKGNTKTQNAETLKPEKKERAKNRGHVELNYNGESKLEEIKRQREEESNQERLRTLNVLGEQFQSFPSKLKQLNELPFIRGKTTTLQVNVGLLCNQVCHHCHVEAGPTKVKENMNSTTVQRLLKLIEQSQSLTTLDLTGGAPELNPFFTMLVEAGVKKGLRVIDRCNLTVLYEPGMEGMASFLAKNKVEVVASLPCYEQDNVDKQRGDGVFVKSINALKWLNSLGYGKPDSPLQLNLVYNPVGPSLPPAQSTLQDVYKEELANRFGITFNTLFTITNMPIKRYADYLVEQGQLESYMKLLIDNFNPSTLSSLMCRNHISINWKGELFDCDFNQQQGLWVGAKSDLPEIEAPGRNLTIWDIDDLDKLSGGRIATGIHCYGCTAGTGSSCCGSLE